MAKKKNKNKPVLKQIDIATYGVGKTSGSSGTSSTSFTGGYADWSKVDSAKSVMDDLMASIEDKKKPKTTTTDDSKKASTKTTPVDEAPTEEVVEEAADEVVEKPTEKTEENVEDTSYDDSDDFTSEELTSDEYKVEIAKGVSLGNLFKEGKLKKSKEQYSTAVQKRMRGNEKSAVSEIRKLKNSKNKDTEETKNRIKELEEIKEKNSIKNRKTKLLKVTLPDGSVQEMTAEEFKTKYADKFDLKSASGRSYGGGSFNTTYFGQTKPMQFKSPFPRRERGYLNVRKNWMPTQSPINYGSPLHQEETQNVEGQQFNSVWEKIQAYGPDMPDKINKFIQHVNYNPETDKPINSFQNKEWVGTITKWLQGQKASIVEAKKNRNNDEQQRIVTSVNTLIQDVITYSGKFMAWKERNSGNQEEGSAGGSVVSEGSKKDERFIGNITFMGDVNTSLAVAPDGKIGLKSFGLPGVKYVEELDSEVFPKDDVGLLQFIKTSEELQKNAQSGKPLNENVIKANADQLLKNKNSMLSWAFDPLYGQSWIQDYVQANPNADVNMFMPESPSFDVDYLNDELHGWLTSKLKESYDKNIPQQPEQKGDPAQNIMNQTLSNVEQEKQSKQGVYNEGGNQPQTPPMTYKKPSSEKAMKILKKYSK